MLHYKSCEICRRMGVRKILLQSNATQQIILLDADDIAVHLCFQLLQMLHGNVDADVNAHDASTT